MFFNSVEVDFFQFKPPFTNKEHYDIVLVKHNSVKYNSAKYNLQ